MKKLKTDWTKEELMNTYIERGNPELLNLYHKLVLDFWGAEEVNHHALCSETPYLRVADGDYKLDHGNDVIWWEAKYEAVFKKLTLEDFYIEEEPQQTQEGEVEYVPVKCGVWEIASLKDDFEAGLLYKKVDRIHDEDLLECVTDYATLWEGLIGGNLHRKTLTRWYDKLDGTEENGVWCWVWDDDMEHPSNDFIVEYRSSTEGDHTYFVSNETVCWDKAKPMSQQAREEMLKIMKENY